MDESRIYVRVIGETISTKELEIYFQSRKQSGGGDIRKIEQINEKESVITFEDHEDARNVTLRTHTINGASVEVSRHSFIEDNSEVPANQTAVVIIRGLSKDTTEDALTNYLENTRRSGGGEVEEVTITGNSARVKFESVEVANSVVQHEKHTLNGATLDVSLEVCEGQGKDGGKTIKVTGLATKTTEDSIINYFENERRSGGGAVESVEFQSDTGVALVTFEDANVVTNVLQRDKHSIDGAVLSVSQSYINSGLTDKEEIQEARTIEVTGLASTTTKDSIVNFFENTRRSGGGEIENVDFTPNKGYAVVTFISAESAQGVVNKENLTLDEAELKVTVRKPVKKLPSDAMRVLVKGLSEKTTSDGLASYMEVVSGLEVSCIEFGEQGCALVTFSDAYDYDFITKKTAKRNLDGNLLALEKVPVCHCVQVTGLNKENTTKDAVLYYFDNPKNGGGDVRDVEISTNEGWALVYFEDPQVIAKVMAKSHILNGAKLQLSLHNPVLAKPVCPPELVKEIPVDAQVMPFIFERHQVGLSQLQEKHGVKISCREDSNNITLVPVDKTAEKDQFDDACKAVASFFHGFLQETMRVSPDVWRDVVEHFKDSRSPIKDRVDIQYLNQLQEIVVTGISQDVEGLVEDLQVLKTKIEGEKAIEASKTTEIISGIPPMRLKFLSDLDFDKELEVKYEHTQVNTNPDKGQVQIRGPPKAIDKAVADVWQAVASTKDVTVEMSENAVEVLRTPACQSFIKEQFTANNLQAVVAFNEEDETTHIVLVMGMNFESAQKAAKILKKVIVEENLILDEGQVQLEKSEKWRQLRDELTEKFVLSIAMDRSSNKLWLTGRKDDVSSAFVYIERFFKENTIVSKKVELPRGCRRFLAKYREQDLRKMQEELNKHSTVIKGMAGDDDKDVAVSGTTDGVDKGMKMIRSLASTVQSQRVPLNKPGMRKALNRSKGKKMLVLVENENKCVIEHIDAQEDASLKKKAEEEKEETKKGKKECECSFLTPEGKSILVFKDNICDRTVDVIVNAANARLQHSSGVAKAIVDAGGETIQDECDQCIIEHGSILEGQVVATSAGKLPFKKIIHAVGPLWRKEATQEKSLGKTPKEEKLLRYAVSNALKEASRFTSIALPAISTGAFGFPHDLCAKVMVDAALEFCEENPSCRLTEIQFTSIDGTVVAAFVNEMNTRFGRDPNFQAPSKGKSAPKVTDKKQGKSRSKVKPSSSPAPVSTDGPNFITTPEGLKLVLVAGDMTREEVDAILNSTSSDLDLSRNASAKALSDAAGPRLQQECSAIGQVQTGGIVVTSGGTLGCKHVFHTSCASWENGKGEQVLRDIITKSLDEAQKRSLSSIAIPAIGTGNLQFPHSRVAAATFEEVTAFSKKNPSSILKEVHLVVYDKDLSSVQAFQTELQSRKGSLPQPPVPEDNGKKKGRRSRGAAAKSSDPDDSSNVDDTFKKIPEELDPLKPEITIGDITVQAETGDITQEVTDAIVTVSNNELDVSYGGGVGKAILTAGGPSIQAECSALGKQKPGAIAVTGAGKLQTRKIYHMVPDKQNMASLKDSIVNCLRVADSHGLTSISFPAVGTGNFNVRVEESAAEILAAIAKFAQDQPISLHFIRIVIFQRRMLEDFHNAMNACISSVDDGPGLFSKIAGGIAGFLGFGKSGFPTSYSTASKKRMSEKDGYLEIFAGTKQDIKKAVEELQKDLADQCTTKVIEKDAISKLSKEQKKTIKDLVLNHDVTINLEVSIARISVRGDPEDVLDVATSIHEILNQQREEEHTRGIEELIFKNIQWHYYEGGCLEAYDTSINSQIENAYDSGQNSVIVLIDGARCEVVFKDMKETCLDDGEERDVVRKEIGKGIPLPVEWSVQPKDSSGKEKDVYLVQLDPINHANEYNKVADEIKKTTSVTITKIERVQNPGLYRAYMVKKDQMDQKSGGNEKFLFHGTAQGSCSSISKFGFNRSYCGKNATVYGNGVYFARDASYSTQSRYSPPDATGNRYLYLAHVLVGECAVGRQGMITPPPKGSDATDAYDSVVDDTGNPNIFVVFYDNQCYPDYLVTFK